MAKPGKDDEDVEIVLDEVPEPEIVVAPQEDAPVITGDPPPRIVGGEEGIETLKANLERERSARLVAEATARDATTRANSAGREVVDSQLTMVNTAIESAKQSMTVLKANYAQASRDGDFDAAADAQAEMATVAVNLRTLENGKVNLEEQAKRPAPQAEPAQNSDPVEKFLSQIQISRRSADWLRNHPDYVTNAGMNRKMVRAHEDLEDEGYVADTDAYFHEMERRLGVSGRQETVERRDDSALSGAAEPVARRSAPAAAPVTRSGTANGADRPGTVRLSAAEREMAANMGQTDVEYAKAKLALQREGKLQ